MDWIISPDLYPIRRVDCHMFIPATTVAYSTMSAVTIMVVQFKKEQWWGKVYLRLGGRGTDAGAYASMHTLGGSDGMIPQKNLVL